MDDTDALSSLGQWIKRRRKALDLTQDALARLVGCSKDLIVKIEGDARRPSRQVADLLATHLQLVSDERDDFVRCARAELPTDRLPPPIRSVPRPTLALARAPEPTAPARGNLPAEISSFVGREHELAELAGLLRPASRLITLTGPGGSGKTRLALRAAEALAPGYPDGAWFVDLAPVSDPQLVASAITHTLGLRTLPDQKPKERLIGWLRTRSLLLLLDNYEHVLDAAPLVTEILRAAPGVRVLVTSRVPLRLTGEQEYPVGALALPLAETGAVDCLGGLAPEIDLTQYEAVQLFAERARAVRLDFSITSQNATAVAAICCRLEGMPLALEIAAARVRIFPPEVLLDRLQQALLPTLVDGARDLPARQQTLQATIEWSIQLLTPSQQRLLARLAVFVGGWTLEAAEALRGEPELYIAAGLGALVEHSLVRVSEQRYTMLETIREFALIVLHAMGAYDDCCRRQVGYLIRYAAAWQEQARNLQSGAALDAVEPELANLESAMRWCRDRARTEPADADLGPQLVALYWWAWDQRRPEALARWLPEVLGPDWPALPTQARATVLILAWRHSWGANHWERTTHWVEQGLALARALKDAYLECEALSAMAEIWNQRRDFVRAEECFSASLAVARAADNRYGMAFALINLAKVALQARRLEQVEANLAASDELFKQIGNVLGQQMVLTNRARLARAHRRYREAIGHLMHANELERQTNHADGFFYSHWNIGILELMLGDDQQATASFVAARRYVDWEMAGRENWAVVLAIWQGVAALIRRDRVGMRRQSRELLDTPAHHLDSEEGYRFGRLLVELADRDDASLDQLDLQAAAIRERLDVFASNELGNLMWCAIDAARAAVGECAQLHGG